MKVCCICEVISIGCAFWINVFVHTKESFSIKKQNCTCYLEQPWKHVGWLAPDDKKARVELAKIGVQILQTLKEKPEEKERRGEGHT